MRLLLALVLLVTSHSAVASDCVLNGSIYPEGSEVNGHRCHMGEWQKGKWVGNDWVPD